MVVGGPFFAGSSAAAAGNTALGSGGGGGGGVSKADKERQRKERQRQRKAAEAEAALRAALAAVDAPGGVRCVPQSISPRRGSGRSSLVPNTVTQTLFGA